MRAGLLWSSFTLAAASSACGNVQSVSDGGAPAPPPSEPSDASPASDSPAQPDSGPPPQATLIPGCANQVLDSTLFPVHGRVRGSNVDGEVCDNGLGTFFLGPEDTGFTPFDQHFFTTTVYSGAAPDGSGVGGAYGFVLVAPADALSAELSGWTGARASALGTYDSATNCGGLDFELTLPVPPGVVCSSEFGPCDPGCEGRGEASVCEPAPAKLHYQARSAAACESERDAPEGDWRLTLTSVSALAAPSGYQHFQTHGQLTATLVNRDDAADSVMLDLDF